MEDREIIALLVQRHPRGLEALTEKYAALCRGLALRILGDARDAEECLNDAWLRAWNAIQETRPEHLTAWLCRIVRNLALNRLARDQRQKRGGDMELLLSELSESLPSGERTEVCADDTVARAITSFLARQDPRQRALFIRRYFYMEPVNELAAAFGMKSTTVSTTLNRLRQKLRLYLEQEGITL